MVRVKICGITRSQDVSAAVEAGADALGFIAGFPKSPRNLSLEAAHELVRSVPPLVSSVLVTNSETLARNIDRVRRMSPDAIQLHGELGANHERVRERLHPISFIKVVQLGKGAPKLSLKKQNNTKSLSDHYDALLTDSYRKGYDGGTGLVSDWEECSLLRRQVDPLPLILSGGLNPGNVVNAMAVVQPFGVDASSGVESAPGIKDVQKILEFVRLAKGGGRSATAR